MPPMNDFGQQGAAIGGAMAYGPPQGLLGQLAMGLQTAGSTFNAVDQGGIGGFAQLGSGVLGAFADKKKQEWDDARRRQLEQEKFLTDSVHEIAKKYQGQDLSQYPELATLMDKYRTALAQDSPGGVIVTPKEAAAIMTWDLRVGKEQQAFGSAAAQQKFLDPFRARQAYGTELQTIMQDGGPAAEAAQANYDQLFPKVMGYTPAGERTTPGAAASMYGTDVRAEQRGMDRALMAEIARNREAGAMARAGMASGRADAREVRRLSMEWQRNLQRFALEKQRFAFGQPIDMDAVRAEYESIAGPPPQGGFNAPPQAVAPPQQGAPSGAVSGGIPLSTLPAGPKRDALAGAPDGTTVTFQGKQWQKRGGSLVPLP